MDVRVSKTVDGKEQFLENVSQHNSSQHITPMNCRWQSQLGVPEVRFIHQSLCPDTTSENSSLKKVYSHIVWEDSDDEKY
jgi:hypothetical protein